MLDIRPCLAGALTLGLALVFPTSPAAAQQQFAIAPAPSITTPASTAPPFGPTYTAAQFGVHHDATATAATAATELYRDAFKTSRREGRAFAIVGAAAVITGILIGGDGGTLIAIGGAGLGLYGLYIWQR